MCGQHQTDEGWENEGGATTPASEHFQDQPGLAAAVAPLLLVIVDYLRPRADSPGDEVNNVAEMAMGLAQLAFGAEYGDRVMRLSDLSVGGNHAFLDILQDLASEALD